MLETLRAQLWPQVEAALAQGHPGRAAQLASLFRALPAVSARVEQLRDAAQAHHLARAKELAGAPEAACCTAGSRRTSVGRKRLR